jgi:hypothetical protein
MKKLLMATVIALLTLTAPAIAQEATGNDFFRDCEQPSWRGWCSGFTLGVANGWNEGVQLSQGTVESGMSQVKSSGICAPTGASSAQALDIVLQFLRDNPADRHFQADFLIVLALRAAWPCT